MNDISAILRSAISQELSDTTNKQAVVLLRHFLLEIHGVNTNWDTANATLPISAAANRTMICRARNGRVLKLPQVSRVSSVSLQMVMHQTYRQKSGKSLT